MQYALAGLAALTLIAILGWWSSARKSKRIGELENQIKVYEAGQEAHEREHEAIDLHASGGDLNDDAVFLRDAERE